MIGNYKVLNYIINSNNRALHQLYSQEYSCEVGIYLVSWEAGNTYLYSTHIEPIRLSFKILILMKMNTLHSVDCKTLLSCVQITVLSVFALMVLILCHLCHYCIM